MTADRPLLVVHDQKEGHLVYDLLLLEDDDEALVCFPRPVARFPFPSETCAFAVAGGSILGVRYDFWNDTLFHDTVMQVGGYDFWEKQPDKLKMRDSEGRLLRWWPMTRILDAPREYGISYKDMPAMLPMGDGTVIRIDTILFDGIYNVERFRLLPGGGWHVVPLPKPPVGPLGKHKVALISAYFVMGTRVWISVTRKGTFSLDTEQGAWQFEGTWELPFEGCALYVPELDSVIGLTAETRLLCAYGFKTGTTPVMRHVWKETFPWPHEECISNGHDPASRPRDMPALAYLGKGKFLHMQAHEHERAHPLWHANDVRRQFLPGSGGEELA